MPPRDFNLVSWGGVGFAEVWGQNQSSAKQNYAFCFFFWKKKNTIRREMYKADSKPIEVEKCIR
jgi:S-formylglutathione hydrolase FrmB